MPRKAALSLLLAAVLLLAATALAQFPVIDIPGLAQAVQMVTTLTAQVQQITAMRTLFDQQVAAITQPFQDLHASVTSLGTSALALPGTMLAAPTLGDRIQDRLDPTNPANAAYINPARITDAALQAAHTITATDDPLQSDPGGPRDVRALADAIALRDLVQAELDRDREQLSATLESLGQTLEFLDQTRAASATAEASTDTSWSGYYARQTAALHTLSNLQSKALEVHAAQAEEELLRRQDARRGRAEQRRLLLTAAAEVGTLFATHQASTDRAANDRLSTRCGGRIFTAGCGDPPQLP